MALHVDTRLLRFDEVVGALGFCAEYDLGVQTIRLDTVIGTVDKARDFDRRFRPTSGRDQRRREELDLAERDGAVIPPTEVYRVGGLHFVKDGHHRAHRYLPPQRPDGSRIGHALVQVRTILGAALLEPRPSA